MHKAQPQMEKILQHKRRPQFFKTATGIHLGTNKFKESRATVTFISIQLVIESCAFSDYFQLETQVSHQHQSHEVQRKDIKTIKQKRNSLCTFVENTHYNLSMKPSFCDVIEHRVIIISKFSKLKNLFEQLLACFLLPINVADCFCE